ncbi:MAG: MmgE/PrpD family protein [Alphaproteobacteria bacterium]|nr:MmgE/PrpD family protein [Alphaproteobacteria bacterium]
MPSLTEQLVQFIEAKPISEADLEKASHYVLDALANTRAGQSTEPGRIIRAWAEGAGHDAGREAFRLGALTHILEADDLHRESVTHPGCVVVPAACALAGSTRADGRAFLTAVLKGFEAMCRIGAAVGPTHYRTWHNTATCGPFGSAYAAGTLLGLEPRAMVHALGNAGTQSAGLWEFIASGAMSKHLHAGRAAEAGVVAAELAAHGFTGAPSILEGSRGFFAAACPDADPEAVLRAPEVPWQLHRTSIKPWPSCRHTHPAIDAALELAPQVDRFRKVEARTYGAAVDVCDNVRPSTEYEAKFSLQHCIAAALIDKEVVFASFGTTARARHADLASQIELASGSPYDEAYPRAWGASVRVVLEDGRVLEAERKHALGDPDAPLSPHRLEAKARDLLALGGVDPEPLVNQVRALSAGGSPAGLADPVA